MRHRRLVLSFAVIASSLLTSAVAIAEPRAVIELFTSQGCSSCPQADKLAGELARDPSLVVVSLAIDYWDYLGWKDTNALPGHATRQRAYSHVRGDREVYTPQVIVNGVAHVIGSDRTAIDSAIARTRKMPGTMSFPVTLAVAGDQLTVTVPAGQGENNKGESLDLPDQQQGSRCDRPRREFRKHRHLSQYRAAMGEARRLGRHCAHLHRAAARCCR